eukprot:bmy_00625T0
MKNNWGACIVLWNSRRRSSVSLHTWNYFEFGCLEECTSLFSSGGKLLTGVSFPPKLT